MIEEMRIKYNCEEMCEGEKHSCKKCNKTSCLGLIVAILATLFLGIIGVIIGAA